MDEFSSIAKKKTNADLFFSFLFFLKIMYRDVQNSFLTVCGYTIV